MCYRGYPRVDRGEVKGYIGTIAYLNDILPCKTEELRCDGNVKVYTDLAP